MKETEAIEKVLAKLRDHGYAARAHLLEAEHDAQGSRDWKPAAEKALAEYETASARLRELIVAGVPGWKTEPPWDEIRAGGTKFWVRGREDPESAAIAVRLITAASRSPEQRAFESVTYGLSLWRMFDVEGDGNPFERRPLYEIQGALWKVPDPDEIS